MTPLEALKELENYLLPGGCYFDPFYVRKVKEYLDILMKAIDSLMIYIKNTTIDCIQQQIPRQDYIVSIRSKITKQIEYEKIVEFVKKYNKEEYEKCLNNFTSK